MTLNIKRFKVPHVQLPPKSHISILFALRSAVFQLQTILRQVHWTTPNDLKHYKVEGFPYTYPPSQNAIRFSLRPAVFELQVILRQVHRVTLNDKTLKVKGTPYTYPAKFQSVLPYVQPFSR